MFTGIIEETGIIKDISRKGDTHRLSVCLPKKPDTIKIGDSISVNGACLSVVGLEKNHLLFDITEETFRNTSLRHMKADDIVNIERSLGWKARLEGHFVLGHIDGARKIRSIKKGAHPHMDITILPGDKIYVVKKGSIAIDGISLTVGALYETAVRVFLIPHTQSNTNLKHKKAGDEVNIEFDILGKYVKNRLLYGKNGSSAVTEELLKNSGFICL
ncbi:MAG: riboflavin synthase [Candidatus Omnitrophota bacterium]